MSKTKTRTQQNQNLIPVNPKLQLSKSLKTMQVATVTPIVIDLTSDTVSAMSSPTSEPIDLTSDSEDDYDEYSSCAEESADASAPKRAIDCAVYPDPTPAKRMRLVEANNSSCIPVYALLARVNQYLPHGIRKTDAYNQALEQDEQVVRCAAAYGGNTSRSFSIITDTQAIYMAFLIVYHASSNDDFTKLFWSLLGGDKWITRSEFDEMLALAGSDSSIGFTLELAKYLVANKIAPENSDFETILSYTMNWVIAIENLQE